MEVNDANPFEHGSDTGPVVGGRDVVEWAYVIVVVG